MNTSQLRINRVFRIQRFWISISLIVIGAILLAACGGPNVAPWDGSVKRAEATAWQINQDQTATAVIAAALGASAAVSTPGATAGPGSSTTTTDNCPTRRQVNDMLFGLNPDGSSKDVVVQVSTEGGAWQINTGKPENWFPVTLPLNKGLIATIHRPGNAKAEVFIADAKEYKAFRGTFRFACCYDPSDDMNAANNAVRILVKENFNGAYQVWLNNKRVQDWTFSVLPGNFTCPADVCPNLAPAATFVPAAPAATAPCPTFGGVQTTPGNDGSPFCKYSGAVVTDKVPAGWRAQYWDGSTVQNATSNTSIKTGEATFRQ